MSASGCHNCRAVHPTTAAAAAQTSTMAQRRLRTPAPATRRDQEQDAILKETMRVLQLNVPLAFRYWPVYQKVQSSTGSTDMWV